MFTRRARSTGTARLSAFSARPRRHGASLCKANGRPALLACFLLLLALGACSEPAREAPKPQAVRVATAGIDTVPIYFRALGTVTPPRTITVKSRVDGELLALHFTEGQHVREGELLAEIDPRPFAVQKSQALGSLARDKALLKDARLDMERYRKLIKEKSISPQQLQAQEALVGQYEGSVIAGEAAVADAELQLTYCRIVAPGSGRVGLRKVDVGNMIRSSDSDGIVVITQMQPMDVIFTLVERQIPETRQAMAQGNPLPVEAWGQENKTLLTTGTLSSLDNQIDTATGTVKAKAVFANEDERLFPNQFVNVRLKVRELNDALVIPTSAVQRSNTGLFVYIVEEGAEQGPGKEKADNVHGAGTPDKSRNKNASAGEADKSKAEPMRAQGKVVMREITGGHSNDAKTVVLSGVKPGDIVVIDGVDRLREGLRVTFQPPPAP